MHEMKIGRHAFLCRIHAHRRHHCAIGQFHLAQSQRLEHRRHRFLDIDVEALGANLLRERLVDLSDKIRCPQRQIVVGDRLGAGHDAERELHRVKIPEAIDVLEPNQRHISGVLGLLDLLAASFLVLQQRGVDCWRAIHGVRQRNRKLGAGADREMRGRLGVA